MICGGFCAVGWALFSGLAAAEEAAEEPEQPVAAVQALLRQERLYSGPVNGVLSGETVAAIRRYQILHNLRVTGRLDADTLRVMLLPSPPPSLEITAADRELLRELSQTPLPDPVAEIRKPIPPGEPPAVVPDAQRKKEGAGKKAGRSKSLRKKEGRGVPSSANY